MADPSSVEAIYQSVIDDVLLSVKDSLPKVVFDDLKQTWHARLREEMRHAAASIPQDTTANRYINAEPMYMWDRQQQEGSQMAPVPPEVLQAWMAPRLSSPTQSAAAVSSTTATVPTSNSQFSPVYQMPGNSVFSHIPQFDGHSGESMNIFDLNHFGDHGSSNSSSSNNNNDATQNRLPQSILVGDMGAPATPNHSIPADSASANISATPLEQPPQTGTHDPENDEDLNSEDDIEDTPEPETNNLIVCQYTRVTQKKNKSKIPSRKNTMTYKCDLQAGSMFLNGRDYLFGKASGEFQFI